MIHRLMKQHLLASTIIAGAVAVTAPAFAQSAPPSVAPAPAADTTGGDIVVTGSRIPHPELTSASPVTVVNALQVKQTGTTRVEDLLNAMPQVFAGQGGSISNGSTGTATVDLRGLGPSRTLVLVNGRRLVPGDPRSPVSDINIIPGALIKRVDILTGGASSVYGADAVSGVVNFVMDTNFDGFKLDSQYSFYNHNNRVGPDVTKALQARNFGFPSGMVTDGATLDTTVVIGAGFDDGRGHVTAYGSYRKIKSITQDRRDYSACSLTGLQAAAAATAGRGFSCGGSGTSAAGTFYTATGGPFHVEGNQFVAGTTPYNFAPTNYYQRPDERYTAGFFAHYDVSDSLKPYMEFMFMDDRTVAQIAPSGDFFNTSTTNCDNPLLSAQQRTLICGARTTGTATLYVARRNVEGGGRRDDLQHTTYRGVVGAKGEIAKGLSYDAYYQFSRVNFAQTYRNDFSVTRLKRALTVVNVNGVPTCQSVVDGTDPNCVPWNIFTAGGVTQAALNYLQIPLLSRGQTQESIAEGSVTFMGADYGLTSPFASEGFSVNVGGQYRKEFLNFETDSNFATGEGAGQGGPTKGVAGSIRVQEAFAEARLPVVQGKPFFEDLTFEAGYRRSKYTTSGIDSTTLLATKNSFSTDTYKVDVSWTPIRDIKFRAAYNRAVRAPNAVNLFSATSFGLDGSTDPCAGAAVGGLVNGFTAAQCARTGVTAAQFGAISANPANQYQGFLGGSSKLTPEISDSYTAGVVLTPSFLKGFQLTVDWFDIKLKNQISTYGADFIITQCVQNGDPLYCSLIHRNAAGSLWRGTPTLAGGGYITDTAVNFGKLATRGVDVTAAYTQRLGNNWGSLGFSLAGTYLNQLEFANHNCAGLYGPSCGTPSPKWRHNFRTTYTIAQGASVSVAWRYFAKVKDEQLSGQTGFSTAAVAPVNQRIGAQSYFDLSFVVPLKDKVTLRLGSQNILDKQPPINGLALGVVMNGNTFPQVYDALGRYVYAGLTFDL